MSAAYKDSDSDSVCKSPGVGRVGWGGEGGPPLACGLAR